jgi:hypothetical protein
MEHSQEQVETAAQALAAFVRAWSLPLNPEDLEEMASAVLEHYDSSENWDVVHERTRAQIAEAEAKGRVKRRSG